MNILIFNFHLLSTFIYFLICANTLEFISPKSLLELSSNRNESKSNFYDCYNKYNIRNNNILFLEYARNGYIQYNDLFLENKSNSFGTELERFSDSMSTLVVDVVNHATCSQNGKIQFQLQNTSPNSLVSYIITNSNDSTLAIIQDTNVSSFDSFGGLAPGIYNVISFEDNSSDTLSAQVTILNNYQLIEYSLSVGNEICEGDGRISVFLTSGNKVKFALSGSNVSFGFDTISIFDELYSGNYILALKDSCGTIVNRNLTILNKPKGFNLVEGNPAMPFGTSCDSVIVSHSLFSIANGELKYPMTFNYFVNNISNGDTISLSQIVTTGGESSLIHLPMTIPFYSNVLNSYNLQIIDGCNDTTYYNQSVSSNVQAGIYQRTDGCDWNMEIWNGGSHPPFEITFLMAPFDSISNLPFNPLLFNSQNPPIFSTNVIPYFNDSIGLPSGNYKIQIVNACNDTVFINSMLGFPDSYIVERFSTPDCEAEKGIIYLHNSQELTNVNDITNPGVVSNLNHGISSNNAKLFTLSSIDSGLHILEMTNLCNGVDTIEIIVPAYEGYIDSFNIESYCGSFSLFFNYIHNDLQLPYFTGPYYYLQYIENNLWYNMDGTPYVSPVTWPQLTGYELSNNYVNPNITLEGDFRILKLLHRPTEESSDDIKVCEEIVRTFTHTNDGFKFDSLYSFECYDSEGGISTYSIVCQASGLNPLTFEIIEYNGIDTLIQNGDNPVFETLESGYYKVRVSDFCNNSIIKDIELSDISNLIIFADSLCVDQNGKLYVDELPFLQYEWRRLDDTTILSTSNELEFLPYMSNLHSGEYSLSVSFANSVSCVNQIIYYTIPPIITTPEAGMDTSLTICDSMGFINLFDYLSPEATLGGIWYNGDGFLISNPQVYSLFNLEFNDNTFTYLLDAPCGSDVISTITISKDTCNVSCVEVTGKLKLNTVMNGQVGYKVLVYNVDNTVGVIDVASLIQEIQLLNNSNVEIENKLLNLEHQLLNLNSKLESAYIEIFKLKGLSLEK